MFVESFQVSLLLFVSSLKKSRFYEKNDALMLKINFTFISTFTKCISDLCAALVISMVEKDFFFLTQLVLENSFFPKSAKCFNNAI